MSGEDPKDREIKRVFDSPEGLRLSSGFEDIVLAFEREYIGDNVAQFGGNQFNKYLTLDMGYWTEKDDILPVIGISEIGVTQVQLIPEGVVQFVKMADSIEERQTMLDAYMGLGIAEAFIAYCLEFNEEPANALIINDRSNVASLFHDENVASQFAIGGHAALLIADDTIASMQQLRAQFGLLYSSSAAFATLQTKFRELLESEVTTKATDKALMMQFVPPGLGKYAVAATWDASTFSTLEFAGAFPMEGEELSELLGIPIEQ